MDQSIAISGLAVDNLTRAEAVERIMQLARGREKHYVVFVNAEAVVLARHNSKYGEVLHRAALRLVDGVGMQWAARLDGKKFVDNCNGTDLFPELNRGLGKRKLRVFLLGGRPGIAQKTAQFMETAYPGLVITGTAHGYLSEKQAQEVLTDMQLAHPDILLVGMGSPYQELWIYDHLDQIPARVSLGVGGLFDFYSNTISRAPFWMRKIDIEWVWRMIRDPKRWPRLLRLFEFIYIILMSKDINKIIK